MERTNLKSNMKLKGVVFILYFTENLIAFNWNLLPSYSKFIILLLTLVNSRTKKKFFLKKCFIYDSYIWRSVALKSNYAQWNSWSIWSPHSSPIETEHFSILTLYNILIHPYPLPTSNTRWSVVSPVLVNWLVSWTIMLWAIILNRRKWIKGVSL